MVDVSSFKGWRKLFDAALGNRFSKTPVIQQNISGDKKSTMIVYTLGFNAHLVL